MGLPQLPVPERLYIIVSIDANRWQHNPIWICAHIAVACLAQNSVLQMHSLKSQHETRGEDYLDSFQLFTRPIYRVLSKDGPAVIVSAWLRQGRP